MTRESGLACAFLHSMIAGSGSVITAVIPLNPKTQKVAMSNLDSSPPTASSRWIPIAAQLVLHSVTLMLLSAVFCQLASGFSDYYRYANIEIPEATSGILRISDICVGFHLPIFFAIMFVDFAFMLMLTSFQSKRWLLSAYSQLFVFFALLVVVYAANWLGNPVIWTVPVP